MKAIVLIILFFSMTAAHMNYQDDNIELKNGKIIETKILSHTKKTVVTEAGKYAIKKIKKIKFFTKNYDDLEFYKELEEAGVEIQFITTPR